MEKKLKLALIGSRGHVGYVFKVLKDLPELDLCAITSGSEEPADGLLQICTERGYAPQVYTDYIEMLDTEKPDIVSVCGPFELHAQMCCDCLERNINVFCEKPIALELEELDRIRAAYDKCDKEKVKIISMVGYRGEAPFRTAYDVVSKGLIGKVKMINTRKSYKLGKRPAYYHKRATYGGTIPWVGSHALDWIYWMSGNAKFKTIHAMHDTADNGGNGDLEMTALFTAVMENNVLASASIEYLRPAAAPTHGDDQVRVAGTLGVVEVMHDKVTLITADECKELELLPERGIFYDFARHLLYGEPCVVDAEGTFELTRACLEARDIADRFKI
ncbi:MAG: Gfo/Idh/MocA family oxidoreductase [Lentisphaeria bacterium]|nr:Gfo/Idh/MocA family oxidoreductase [Lentisphaeria bacterium]